VGKKFISLLARSILKVYNGVFETLGLAATKAIAKNATARLVPIITFPVFFVFITSFHFYVNCIRIFKNFSVFVLSLRSKYSGTGLDIFMSVLALQIPLFSLN